MIKIAKEVEENPQSFENYPQKTPVKRADETLAARHLDIKYDFSNK